MLGIKVVTNASYFLLNSLKGSESCQKSKQLASLWNTEDLFTLSKPQIFKIIDREVNQFSSDLAKIMQSQNNISMSIDTNKINVDIFNPQKKTAAVKKAYAHTSLNV